jgi:two-component system, chemotaxis family, protein-glutamate methylesterase/glutaminase
MSNPKIRVLIVDDSAVVREALKDILGSDRRIEVMGTAADPFRAAEKIRLETPDVILLDVEMPRMDGITFLQKIMSQHPIPVVICSSLAEAGCETTFKALEYGAVEIIQKPRLGARQFIAEARIRICDAVKSAAVARLKAIVPPRRVEPKLTADAVIAAPTPKAIKALPKTSDKVVVVGASTGGTEALRIFLEDLPLDTPGLVIVQHMPEHFTKAFAQRLNSICRIEVREAVDGDSVLRGRALICPGNYHILLKRSGALYYVAVKSGPLVKRHRPSVDVLFRSAARYAGANAIGVIMTGMADDGAAGLLEMRQAGAYTIAQNEETCVVYGMPMEAVKLGAVERILPLQAIAGAVIREAGKG